MIVTCTSCQSRFRIPDGRIGPKGAKVRCSKCRAVFVVKPGAAAGDASAPPPDPFAAPPPDPFAPPPDPFAVTAPVAGPAGPPGDPFARPLPADPFAAPPAVPPSPGPFAAAAPSGSRTGSFHLPVTDLSDLAGGAAPPPAGLAALAPPLPAALAAPPAGGPAEAAGAVSSADDLVLEEPSRAVPVAPPPIPPAAPAFEFGLSPDLAERGPVDASGAAAPFEFGALGTDLSEPPAAEPVPGLEIASAAWTVPGGAHVAGADPFAAPGAREPFGAEGPAAEASASRVPTVTEPIADQKPPAPALTRPVIPARRKAGAAPDVGPLSAPGSRGRLQGFVANALSLAALLAVAGGLLSWWLKDAGRERAGGGPVAPVGVSSGLYEAAGGSPVLFVRGEVRSRGAVPVGRVAVRAEVLLGGEVRARAEGLAGAVPTAEEVAQIEGPQGAARLRARVASRAPARLEPGGSLPFLVIFDAVPEGFRDAVFRVAAEPLPETARAP